MHWEPGANRVVTIPVDYHPVLSSVFSEPPVYVTCMRSGFISDEAASTEPTYEKLHRKRQSKIGDLRVDVAGRCCMDCVACSNRLEAEEDADACSMRRGRGVVTTVHTVKHCISTRLSVVILVDLVLAFLFISPPHVTSHTVAQTMRGIYKGVGTAVWQRLLRLVFGLEEGAGEAAGYVCTPNLIEEQLGVPLPPPVRDGRYQNVVPLDPWVMGIGYWVLSSIAVMAKW
jgi:hypothetical protein